jgi:hypothetical protein
VACTPPPRETPHQSSRRDLRRAIA